jgi:hypothetical protein
MQRFIDGAGRVARQFSTAALAQALLTADRAGRRVSKRRREI